MGKRSPVWVHGDVSAGNLLVQTRKLRAVIDFGGLAIGDPACDLVIAWTFLKNKSREIFIQNVNMDQDTITRAKAWALWKATYELCNIEDKNSIEAKKQLDIINDVLS